MRFEYCYSTPLCGPSRCRLLTGRYPFRTGLINNQSHSAIQPRRETMIPTVMKQAGYVTASVGKWGQMSHGPGAASSMRPRPSNSSARHARPRRSAIRTSSASTKSAASTNRSTSPAAWSPQGGTGEWRLPHRRRRHSAPGTTPDGPRVREAFGQPTVSSFPCVFSHNALWRKIQRRPRALSEKNPVRLLYSKRF